MRVTDRQKDIYTLYTDRRQWHACRYPVHDGRRASANTVAPPAPMNTHTLVSAASTERVGPKREQPELQAASSAAQEAEGHVGGFRLLGSQRAPLQHGPLACCPPPAPGLKSRKERRGEEGCKRAQSSPLLKQEGSLSFLETRGEEGCKRALLS